MVQSILFNSLAVLFLVLTAYMLLADRRLSAAGRGAVAFLAAALCALIGNLDQFETLKVSTSGLEAKTREFQGVINEAKATVASLHELAAMTAALQVDLLAGEGRFGGGFTIQHKDELKGRLMARLRALGLPEDQLAEVERADRPWVIRDYVIAVLTPLNDGKDPTKMAAYATAVAREKPPTPDECAALLQQFNADDEKIKQLLDDYRYYFETDKQRRPEVWRDRANW